MMSLMYIIEGVATHSGHTPLVTANAFMWQVHSCHSLMKQPIHYSATVYYDSSEATKKLNLNSSLQTQVHTLFSP